MFDDTILKIVEFGQFNKPLLNWFGLVQTLILGLHGSDPGRWNLFLIRHSSFVPALLNDSNPYGSIHTTVMGCCFNH
jgi:hypothetical protein